jgi:flagellar biosynthetic protein FliQ
MTFEETLTLVTQFLRTAILVSSPILLVSLIAGIAVGIVQAATQVNESSAAFVVKAAAVIVVVVALGSALTAELVRYTRESFRAVERVVR